METKLKIMTANLPRLLADLSHSNQFLKLFSMGLTAICFLLILLTLYVCSKEPVILTLAPTAEIYETKTLPKAEDEILVATKAYIDKRYKWDPSNVFNRLKLAENFVSASSLKAYQSAAIEIVKFSTEKLVSQKVYPEKIVVDLDKKTISISGDRLTGIQGVKAAGDLRLELSFESGPRTKQNPWGLYITKEKEE